MKFRREVLLLSAVCLGLFLATVKAEVVNFGPNVFLFTPSTPTATIQSTLDNLFALQNNVNTSQFDTNRYAILFEPGTYDVNINMGYYMQVLGLGGSRLIMSSLTERCNVSTLAANPRRIFGCAPRIWP
jgi:hypothetical protein